MRLQDRRRERNQVPGEEELKGPKKEGGSMQAIRATMSSAKEVVRTFVAAFVDGDRNQQEMSGQRKSWLNSRYSPGIWI